MTHLLLLCSTFGQGLNSSTFVWETSFCALIALLGLVLFAHLIGNMEVIKSAIYLFIFLTVYYDICKWFFTLFSIFTSSCNFFHCFISLILSQLKMDAFTIFIIILSDHLVPTRHLILGNLAWQKISIDIRFCIYPISCFINLSPSL